MQKSIKEAESEKYIPNIKSPFLGGKNCSQGQAAFLGANAKIAAKSFFWESYYSFFFLEKPFGAFL